MIREFNEKLKLISQEIRTYHPGNPYLKPISNLPVCNYSFPESITKLLLFSL